MLEKEGEAGAKRSASSVRRHGAQTGRPLAGAIA